MLPFMIFHTLFLVSYYCHNPSLVRCQRSGQSAWPGLARRVRPGLAGPGLVDLAGGSPILVLWVSPLVILLVHP